MSVHVYVLPTYECAYIYIYECVHTYIYMSLNYIDMWVHVVRVSPFEMECALFYIRKTVHRVKPSRFATDIGSEAFLIPSHLPAVVCPSINFFSNRIGPLTVPLIFPIFGLNVYNNITPEPLELEYWFLLVILKGFFYCHKYVKIGIFLKVFSHFPKKFVICDHETWFTGISGYFQVCVLSHISGPFWPQIGPNLGQKSVFCLFCEKFPLDSNEICF